MTINFVGFCKQGARVVVHFNSDKTKADADKTVADIIASGGEAFAVQGDLTVVENNTKLFDAAIEKYGAVDVAINTTGMVIKKPIVNVTEEDYDKIFAVNSKAAFFFLQEAGKKLADNGKICTIVSSLLAAYTNDYAIYSGSKAPIQQIVSESKELDIRTKIENALDSMENLVNLYQQGDLLTKRTIGCLIFPQKVEFDGKSFQTPKMNIVAQCIYQYNNGLGNKKNRHKRVKTSNVGLVTSTGFKPVTF